MIKIPKINKWTGYHSNEKLMECEKIAQELNWKVAHMLHTHISMIKHATFSTTFTKI